MPTADEQDRRAYKQIATAVRKAINAGTYQPGTPAPSVTTLTQEYGHARQTCSKALRVLVKEGLLVRYPGLGYYVAGKPEGTGPVPPPPVSR